MSERASERAFIIAIEIRDGSRRDAEYTIEASKVLMNAETDDDSASCVNFDNLLNFNTFFSAYYTVVAVSSIIPLAIGISIRIKWQSSRCLDIYIFISIHSVSSLLCWSSP